MEISPFVSSVMTVKPEWIDFNGHLNMAYYNVLFDQAADQIYDIWGFGPEYQKTGFTTYVADFHLSYVRELHVHDPVLVSLQLLDCDPKRLHMYQEIRHQDGWLAATAESLALHIDQSGPRVAPMPDAVFQRVQQMHAQHARLPTPERVGRKIGIRRAV